MNKSSDILVRIVMGDGVDGQGSIPSKVKRYSFIPQLPDRLWDPPWLITSGVKEPCHEDDHPKYRAEVQNGAVISPFPFKFSWHGV
jgi:hypothetical protein